MVLWLLFTLRFGSNKDLDFCQNSNKNIINHYYIIDNQVDLHWHGYANGFPFVYLVCMVPLLITFHALMQIKLAVLLL